MAANSGEAGGTVPASIQIALQQERRQVMLDGWPRGLDPFGTVIRIFSGDALAPSADAIGLDIDQQNAAAVNAAKARFKEMNERHVKFAQRYRFDFHNDL